MGDSRGPHWIIERREKQADDRAVDTAQCSRINSLRIYVNTNRQRAPTSAFLTDDSDPTISDFDNEMRMRAKNGRQEKQSQDLYGGLIRLHILHHASKQPIFGLWFIEELARHGYKLSPGTLYPLLHGLEHKGYLRSMKEREGKRLRRMYQATPQGRKALATARQRVSELFGELLEHE